jgi:hypothetical protein
MNPTLFYRSFTKQSLPKRIGNLAVTVNRFADAFEQRPEQASSFMQEAMWFMEWIGTNLEPDKINLMVKTQKQMAIWRKNWNLIIENESTLQNAQQEARVMGEEFLTWAGLNQS